MQDYLQTNKQAWNEKTAHHVQSEFYDVKSFLQGKDTINDIEGKLLGDISGKTLLHLQCHFGMDTISLARRGATAAGVDFSDKAIDKARALATELHVDTRFILSDVYSLPQQLDEKFDIVFTSYGTIGWLPDLEKWAQVIKHFLKPGGAFVFAEFHPVIWMYDNDFTKVEYSYFKSDPIVETESGTYAQTDAPIKTDVISWNHSLSEVFQALLGQGLTITHFEEYNYSPYNCLKHMESIGEDRYIISKFGNKLALVYALKAVNDEKHG